MKKMMMLVTVSLTLVIGFLNLSKTLKVENTNNRQVASAGTVSNSVKKSWAFNYKDLSKKSFSIKKEANTYEEAFKSASRECYQQLTEGRYPGEEKGLDIIDICANPKI